MAKTFTDSIGRTIEIIEDETSVDTNEDILTGEISNYFVCIEDGKFEVDKRTYDAVKKYIEN